MIRFEHVSLSYDKNHAPALDDVSFDIERGEFVFLVGQSGSGKSSLMRLMTHEVVATQGAIHVAGRDLMTMPRRKVPALRRDIGVVFQDFRLLENKTVEENVAFVLEILGQRRSSVRRAVPEALELVGLEQKAKRFPHELSGGEQQRVAIARAVVKRPAILLADEPTGNLDPANSDEVVDVLDRINRTSTTLVMATHDNSLVDRLQRRVLEMSDGRLVRDSTGGYRAEVLDDAMRRAPRDADESLAAGARTGRHEDTPAAAQPTTDDADATPAGAVAARSSEPSKEPESRSDEPTTPGLSGRARSRTVGEVGVADEPPLPRRASRRLRRGLAAREDEGR